MRLMPYCFAIALLLVMVARAQQQQSDTNAVLNSYFDRYCNYTGGLGIHHVASHKYDYEFRQRLRTTEDRELKRLFVLEHLYREVDWSIQDFEKGVVEIGKGIKREMTPDERVTSHRQISKSLDDLLLLDPQDPLKEIAAHRRTIAAGRER